MIKTIIFDLDDTLYDYRFAHKQGLAAAYETWKLIVPNSNFVSFKELYDKSRIWVKRYLPDTASSHSRALYIQKMVETSFSRPNTDAIIQLFDSYYSTFYDNLIMFTGVNEVLSHLKSKTQFNLVCLTNMLSETQFRKLSLLGLGETFDKIITSESVEHEKPHPHIFTHTLTETNSKPKETVMIGDSFMHDIEPAIWLGLNAIWFNPREIKPPENLGGNYFSITQFIEILSIIKRIEGVSSK